MTRFVLDASVMLRWVLPGTSPPEAERIRRLLGESSWSAVAPALLHWELANGVVMAERRGELIGTLAEAWATTEHWLALIAAEATNAEARLRTCELAREHRLTGYDAAYLELALRRGLPLATLDEKLRRAARAAGLRVDF